MQRILRTCLFVGVVTVFTATGPAVRASEPHRLLNTLRLSPDMATAQPVGTPIQWTATASGTAPLIYQFSVGRKATGPFTTVRDFSPKNTFTYAPLWSGIIYYRVVAKAGYGVRTTVSRVVPFAETSRVVGGQPVVSATGNPLVALYSAPPCSAGVVDVVFRPASAPTWTQTTNYQQCKPGRDRNFLVAGLLPNTAYVLASVVATGSTVVTSTAQTFTTGSLPTTVPFLTYGAIQPPDPASDTAAGIILHAGLNGATTAATPVATDLSGHVLWYADQTDLSSPFAVNYQQVGGPWGSVVYLYGNDGLVPPNADDVFRIIDLAGDPVQETNVAEVDEQLATMGAPDQIYGFHHDALRLPNGNTVLLGMTERLITTTAMMGDMLVVLDRNLRVRWYWDAFDHLDTSRGPLLGETCAQDPPGYCSTLPALGTGSPIDWLHTNAISWSPSDDNLVLSLRHQDWIIKIAYENGRGDGHVIWRLGQDGDFRLVPLQPSDPYPWFSHQHDATIVAGTPTTLVLFDNGNVRCATLAPPCNSRGQSYVIDEQTRVVTQTLNADLGVYSAALGSAQRLANGNYAFGAGFLFPGPFAQEMEVTPGGTIVYTGQATGALEYRAWRLRSMFDTINPRCPLC